MQNPEPAKMSSLLVFLPYILRYPLWIVAALLSVALLSAGSLALPLLAGRVFDLVAQNTVSVAVQQNFYLAGGAILALAFGTFGQVYYGQILALRVVSDLRKFLFSHLVGLSRSFHDQTETGEVLTRLTADTRDISGVLTASVFAALRQILVLIGGCVMMASISAELSLRTLLIIPIALALVLAASGRVQRLAQLAANRYAAMSTLALESFKNISEVQNYRRVPHIVARFDAMSDTHFSTHKVRAFYQSALFGCITVLIFGVVVYVLWVGVGLIGDGTLTSGELVQFSFYALLAASAGQGVAETWTALAQASGAASRLDRLMRTKDTLLFPEKASSSGEIADIAAPCIEFDNVKFAYPAAPDTPVLKGVSFSLERGKTLAIVGASGSGKSTLFKLLVRQYDCEGSIRIHGQDISSLPQDALRSRFALVSQEPAMFSTTIRENISFAVQDIQTEDIETAAKKAFAHAFILEQPNAYETVIGEAGQLLSGGQRARIGLARAFLTDAEVLLLDEPTSALDSDSEKYIQQALEELRAERTVIIIAHRFSTIQEADWIVVMDQGRVAAQGTHTSLLETSEIYKNLAKLQFLHSQEH